MKNVKIRLTWSCKYEIAKVCESKERGSEILLTSVSCFKEDPQNLQRWSSADTAGVQISVGVKGTDTLKKTLDNWRPCQTPY